MSFRGSAMRELIKVRQIPGESKRRWFSSTDFDLIVWLADDGGCKGFELCYRTGHRERAIVWTRASGYRHMNVDDGEGRAGAHKATPIMGVDGRFDANAVHAAFAAESAALPAEISSFVLSTLRAHPNYGRPADDANATGSADSPADSPEQPPSPRG
jgi:hypothetical protein